VPNDDDDMDKPVTKRELHEALEIWGGALEARIDAKLEAKLDAKLGAFEARIDAKLDAKLDSKIEAMGARFSAELAQHTNRILDAVYEITGAVDEKYSDLPARVTRLEAKVFPPKRQRRR
jgi:hypothetical protein